MKKRLNNEKQYTCVLGIKNLSQWSFEKNSCWYSWTVIYYCDRSYTLFHYSKANHCMRYKQLILCEFYGTSR